MGRLNLNMLFDKLTNFKIGFVENPTSTQISNKDLVFVFGGKEFDFQKIRFNRDTNQVEIYLE